MIKIKSIVYLIVALLLFVLTFIYLKIDLVTVLKLISDVNILLLCGGLIIFSFTFPVYSFRSYILIKTIKKNISYVTISVITYINMAVNYLTPFKLGIPGKLYFLKKIYSISYTDGGIISVIEILIEVLALALFSVFWSLIFGQSGYILPLILLCIFLSIFILGILFFKIPNIIKKIISKISNKFAKIEYTLENSNKIAFRCLVPSILLTLLILIIDSIKVSFFINAFSGELNIAYIVGILAISNTLGTIGILPGGIGIRDASIMLLFARFGLTPELAASVTILDRLLSTSMTLIIGLISSYYLTKIATRSEKY